MSENADLSRSAFLISSAVTYGYSPYSRKLGHWWSRTNLMNAVRVRLPVLREAFEIGEDSGDPGRAEQLDRVLGVLVEIGVEDAHVLEVQTRTDVEEIPPQVVQLERR